MPDAYDVFVSYSRADAGLVEPLVQRLRAEGVTPWFDRGSTTAGKRWQEELADGIGGAAACAVFVGPGPAGRWSVEEVDLALVRAVDDPEFRVFLVLLPGVGAQFDPTRVSPFLKTRTWVDLRAGTGDLRPLLRAIAGVPADAEAAPSEIGPNPYAGLRPFVEEDAARFFGRDAEIQQALERLTPQTRFLALVGASGSGKSSLAHAGVVPALRRAHPQWTVKDMRPGAVPLETLAVVLGGGDARTLRTELHEHLDALHLHVRERLAGAPADARLVLVVDQLEEAFTLCGDRAERDRFFDHLVFAATAAEGRVVVLLTLRADFYPLCADHPALAGMLASHQLLLGPMSRAALREAIVAPALGAGAEFAPGLVEHLLDEAGDEPGALPLLQTALYELWNHRRGRFLTLDAYQHTGGVAGAVERSANHVYDALTATEQAIARRVMLRLTTPGERTRDTRRSAALSELVHDPAETGDVRRVVTAFADARLLTTGEDQVDIAHEALIDGWSRLRGWLAEGREGRRIRGRVTEAAAEWEEGEREAGLLLAGTHLATAAAWRDEHPDEFNTRENAFLDASLEAVEAERDRELRTLQELATTRQRAARRLTLAAAGLLVLALGAAGVAVYAFDQRATARRQERAAAEQAKTALARQLLAQAREAAPRNLDDALLRALAAERLRPGPEAEGGLANALTTDHRLATVLRPSGPPVAALAATEGAAVSVDMAGTVTRWDLRSGRAAGAPLAAGAVAAAAVSADLRVVATGDRGGTVRVWRLDVPGHPHVEQTISEAPIDRLELDGAGRHVVVHTDGASSVWTVGPPIERIDLPSTAEGIAHIAPDGRHVVFAGYEQGTDVVDLRTGGVRVVFDVSFEASYTPDGRWFFTHAESGAQLLGLDGRRRVKLPPSAAVISPDGTRAGGVSGQTYRVTTIQGQDQPAPLSGTAVDDRARAAFAGNDRLLLATSDGKLTLWALEGSPALRAQPLPDVIAVADGAPVAVASVGRDRFQLFDPFSRRTHGAIRVSDLDVADTIALSADGRFVSTQHSSEDGDTELFVWERGRGERPARLPLGNAEFGASSVAFAPDGSRLAAARDDGSNRRGSLRLWDLNVWPPALLGDVEIGAAAGAAPSPDAPPPDLTRMAYARDGRTLFAVDDAITALVALDPRTGARRVIAPATEFALAADRRAAATIDEGGQVWFWRLPGWHRATAAVTRVAPSTSDIALSTDGRRLAISEREGLVTVWDTRTRARIASLDADEWIDLVWNGDTLIAFQSGGEAAITWDLSRDALRRRACAVANRSLSPRGWRALAVGQPYAELCPGLPRAG